MGAVMRLIPLKIPHYSEIGLPESLITKMTQIPNGLILVTGPTGRGKTAARSITLPLTIRAWEFGKRLVMFGGRPTARALEKSTPLESVMIIYSLLILFQ